MNKKKFKKQKAFTLVELLVVISIISLMMALLMPALNNAKNQARKIVCQSNLKQQAMACGFYLLANEDAFPTVGVENPGRGDFKSAASWTDRSWGGQKGIYEYSYKPDMLLNSYIGANNNVDEIDDQDTLKIFRCPSDKGSMGSDGQPLNFLPTHWEVLGRSYAYNVAGLTAGSKDKLGLIYKRTTDVKNTSRLILVGDDSAMRAHYWGLDPCRYAYWHNRKELGWGNVAFVDNHVRYIQMRNDNPDYQNGPDWTVISR